MKAKLDCFELVKDMYENICNCEEYKYIEVLNIYILLCESCVKNKENESITGDKKYFIIRKFPITLQELQKLIEFYENFIINECSGKYRKAQLIICRSGGTDKSIENYINAYNEAFKDTRPQILLI